MLTLKASSKVEADDSHFFPKIMRLDISCESSASTETFNIKCQALFSLKKTTGIKISSADVVIGDLRVNKP